MTGNGKTHVCIGFLEEAAINRIPCRAQHALLAVRFFTRCPGKDRNQESHRNSSRPRRTLLCEDTIICSRCFLRLSITLCVTHQDRLWAPECFPIFLSDLQRSKHIDRKACRDLSLGFIPHYLFVQNERHGF